MIFVDFKFFLLEYHMWRIWRENTHLGDKSEIGKNNNFSV